MNTQTKKNWRWLDESQLVRNKITHRYMIEGDYRHDPLRFGFWVNPDSKTYTLLALKGCRFKDREHA